MQKIKIKKGDIVKVIAGDSKGQQGKVLVINRTKSTCIVEGINMVSKHSKPTAKTPQGGIIKMESSIHISNLMLVDAKGNATRIGRREENDKIVRYSKKSGEVIK
jgi:large subunit ribosomal protein L24